MEKDKPKNESTEKTEIEFRIPTRAATRRQKNRPGVSTEALAAAGRRKSTSPAPVFSGVRTRSRSPRPKPLASPHLSPNKFEVLDDQFEKDFQKLCDDAGKLPDPNIQSDDSLEEGSQKA